MGGEVGRAVAATAAQVNAARARVAQIEENLKVAQSQVDKNNQALIPLNAMQRDADASRTLLQAVLSRIQQIAQQNAIEKPDARVISSGPAAGRAVVPEDQDPAAGGAWCSACCSG